MPKYKTIYILLFLLRQAVCPCTRSDLMDKVNIGMTADCDQTEHEILNSCRVICTESKQLIERNTFKSSFINVECKNNEWTYYSLLESKQKIYPYLTDFTCVEAPTEKTFCPFEELDNNIISVVGIYNLIYEEIYVKIICRSDESVVMNVKCNSNHWQTDMGEIFDEAFYRTKCKVGCDTNSLENTLNKFSVINNDCPKSAYDYGESCAIYCKDKNNVFQTSHPVTSLKVVCKGTWRLEEKQNSRDPLTEELLNQYLCAHIGDHITLCSLDSLNREMLIVEEHLTELAYRQKTLIRCRYKNKIPLEIYCDGNRLLVNNNGDTVGLKDKFFVEYCSAVCRRDELIGVLGEDATLSCDEQVYEFGEGCHAYCSESDAFFVNPKSSTKVNIQCKEKWYFEWADGSFASLDTEDIQSKLTCRKKREEEMYCSLEKLEIYANFPLECKGLGEGQELSVSCRNTLRRDPFKFTCDATLSESLINIDHHCNVVCETSTLDSSTLDLDDVPSHLMFNETHKFTCREKDTLDPIEVYCSYDGHFYTVHKDVMVTPEHSSNHCAGTCNFSSSTLLVDGAPAKINEKLKVNCPETHLKYTHHHLNLPTQIEYYCNEDGNFRLVESDRIFSLENIYLDCNVHCRNDFLYERMASDVSTNCALRGEYGEVCFIFCTHPNHLLYVDFDPNVLYDRTQNTAVVCNGDIVISMPSEAFTTMSLDKNVLCIDGCVKGELIDAMGEDVTLSCSEDVYNTGESCHAYCSQPETVFDIPESTTKVELRCEREWHIKYKSTHFKLNAGENGQNFRCRKITKEETFCKLGNAKALADFSHEYKGLGNNQLLEFSCKDILLGPGQLFCAGSDDLSSYEMIDRYCTHIEKCSLEDFYNQLISIETEFASIAALQTTTGRCVTNGDITFELVCLKNNSLHLIDSGEEATKANIMKRCRVGCTEERFNDLNKNYLTLITKNCLISTAQGGSEAEACHVSCTNDEETLLFCKDDDFQYHVANGIYTPAVISETLIACVENR